MSPPKPPPTLGKRVLAQSLFTPPPPKFSKRPPSLLTIILCVVVGIAIGVALLAAVLPFVTSM